MKKYKASDKVNYKHPSDFTFTGINLSTLKALLQNITGKTSHSLRRQILSRYVNSRNRKK